MHEVLAREQDESTTPMKSGNDSNCDKILIIDDDKTICRLLEMKLTKLGHHVRTAQTGQAGFQLAKEWIPDLILLDIHLPDAIGLKVLEMIQDVKELADPLIVLMTADTSEDVALEGLKKNVHEFAYKPLRFPEFTLKVGHWLERKKRRDEFKRLTQERLILNQYFSKDVVSKIIDDNIMQRMKGELLEATIMFLDIRNFTAISERLEPDMVADLLNYIFTDVMDVIFANKGSVNNIIGDAILATFGCPINSANDTYNAVKTALDIRETIKLFNLVRPPYLDDDIAYGIGITTGNIFAGNVGSYRRMAYTVIGDVVNTSSRLQSLTKQTHTDILIDGATRDKLGSLIKVKKEMVSAIRGKSQTIDVYALEGLNQDQAYSE